MVLRAAVIAEAARGASGAALPAGLPDGPSAAQAAHACGPEAGGGQPAAALRSRYGAVSGRSATPAYHRRAAEFQPVTPAPLIGNAGATPQLLMAMDCAGLQWIVQDMFVNIACWAGRVCRSVSTVVSPKQ